MACKEYNYPPLGDIVVYKKRGVKKLSLRVSGTKIKVTQPYYVPYLIGYNFAVKNHSWVSSQINKSPVDYLSNHTSIGKNHVLVFKLGHKIASRVSKNEITITYTANDDIGCARVQKFAKEAVKRALKKEAELILPNRVMAIASQTDTQYSNLKFKSLKARWGSCSSKRQITLNIYLMMCPYELIDYVILHELAHTKHMNHKTEFWAFVAKYMSDYKQRRKDLKKIQASILYLQN